MAYCVDAQGDFIRYDATRPARAGRPQNLLAGLALGAISAACFWTLYVNLNGNQPDIALPPTVTVVTAKPAAPAAPAETVVVKQPAAQTEPPLFVAPTFDNALFNGKSLMPPMAFAQSAPMKSALQLGSSVPRSVASAPTPARQQVAQVQKPTVQKPSRGGFSLASAESTPVETSAFEKIFGKRENANTALAYSSPDGGVSNDGQNKSPGKLPANTDGVTAVYDITARTVYMPDGSKLEAHSGLRDKLDNPKFVHVRMWGATPPHTYDLVEREALFHGVRAIRLIPTGGEGAIFGRTGLLAHTYMLGPNGDSNGCVSFRQYDKFLRAFLDGKVKRLVVVASGGTTALASND